jgi:hypothetical protein
MSFFLKEVYNVREIQYNDRRAEELGKWYCQVSAR